MDVLNIFTKIFRKIMIAPFKFFNVIFENLGMLDKGKRLKYIITTLIIYSLFLILFNVTLLKGANLSFKTVLILASIYFIGYLFIILQYRLMINKYLNINDIFILIKKEDCPVLDCATENGGNDIPMNIVSKNNNINDSIEDNLEKVNTPTNVTNNDSNITEDLPNLEDDLTDDAIKDIIKASSDLNDLNLVFDDVISDSDIDKDFKESTGYTKDDVEEEFKKDVAETSKSEEVLAAPINKKSRVRRKKIEDDILDELLFKE